MMSQLFMLIFLMPLCFLNYWLVQYFMFIISFLFLINVSFGSSFSYLTYYYGMDNLSYYLILLSCWICSLMILASSKIFLFNNYYGFFSFLILILMFSLIMVFCSLNLFMFYFFFEVSLIPLICLIIGWGYQPERLMAGLYLLFYTIFFSLPMMVGLFIMYNKFNSFMFFEFYFFDSVLLYFLINLVFLVKIPLYSIHLWLPKAHVEAPVSGSMILAGIMLKLGGYGMMRLMKLFIFINFYINIYIMVISIFGGFIVSLICMYQTDIKSLIAYSSVSHMSMVLAGIMTMSYIGFMGSFILMLAHGLCSSGLFCLANFYYERFNTRNMYMVKGMINILPNFSLMVFLFSIFNMASPPSLNLLGEVFLFKSIISFDYMFIFLLMLLSFFSAFYSIYLYTFLNHGQFMCGFYSIFTGLNREYLLLILHLFPLIMMILSMDLFMII